MSDWKKPLANPMARGGTRYAALRASYQRDSGSMMLQFELTNELSETEQAHLLVFTFEGKSIGRWLPKSQIKIPYADVVEIPRWLVERIKEEMKQWTA